MNPVVFDAQPIAVEDGMIIRSGLLFRAGDYPTQKFHATPETLRQAAASFTGAGMVELEHFRSKREPSILDGKIGEVRKLWTNEDGTELHGEVALPPFIDERHAEFGRKVSAVWNRVTNAFTGIGLVLSPAVTDAALMSAYATFAGARHSAADIQALQQIHDISTQQGAVCQDTEPDADDIPTSPMNGGKQPSPEMLTSASPSTGFSKGKRMNFKEWLTGKAKEDGVEVDEALFNAPTTPAPDPEIATLKAELAAQKATFAAAAATARNQEAALFADAQVVACTILPAGRDALAALYTFAAEAQGQTVTFSDGKTASPLELLTAFVASLPAHTLANRSVPAGASVLAPFSTPNPNAPMTPERKKQLLELSNLGRVVANGKAN